MPWTDAAVLVLIAFLMVAIPGVQLAKRYIGGGK